MEEVVVLGELCRACLLKTTNMKNLSTTDANSLDLLKKLSCICNLKEIEISNSLPNFLCISCEEKLKIAYEFQQLCFKSQEFILDCMVATHSLSTVITLPHTITFEENLSHEFGIQKENVSQEISTVTDKLQQSPTKSYTIDESCKTDYLVLQSVKEDHDESNDSDHCDSITNPLFFKPLEIQRNINTNQTMRLSQYSADDVSKVINKIRARYSSEQKCLLCNFISKDLRAMSVHMTKLHMTEKQNWCSFCNKTFEHIYNHMKESHSDEYKCPLCGKETSNTSHLLEHLACHSIERNFICDICKKAFISARHLKIHSNRHSKGKVHSCKYCYQMFSFKKSLREHLTKHANETTVENEVGENLNQFEENVDNLCIPSGETNLGVRNFCSFCDRKVRSLDRHMKLRHSDKEKGTSQELCTYCGKQFSSKSKLTIHIRTHTGECKYECSYCNLKMSTRSHLVAHERIHTGQKPYVCEFCNKRFTQSSTLRVHMKIHTGRPEQCMLCLKRFCRPSELKQHMRIHTGEKPYLCSQCGSAFKQKSHLVEHMATHSNEKPYQCEYCERNFKHLSSLKSHNLRSHLVKLAHDCPPLSGSFAIDQHILSDQIELDDSKTTLESLNMYQITPTSLTVYTPSTAVTEMLENVDVKYTAVPDDIR